MSRLAKSSHVVLREGAELMRKYSGPSYVAERLSILSEIARDNSSEARRLCKVIHGGVTEEFELLGNGEPIEGVRA